MSYWVLLHFESSLSSEEQRLAYVIMSLVFCKQNGTTFHTAPLMFHYVCSRPLRVYPANFMQRVEIGETHLRNYNHQ